MIYNYVYEEAFDIINKRRLLNEHNADLLKEELYFKIPELKNIDFEISLTGKKVITLFLDKNSKDTIDNIKEENNELQKKRKEILINNGYSPDFLDVKYTCKNCNDNGYVGTKMCSCLKSEISRIRLKNSEIGTLAQTQSFNNFSLKYYTKSIEVIKYNFNTLKEFAENFNDLSYSNYLLLGNTGLGKTHLSTAVGVTVINKGYNVIYKSIQSLIDDFADVNFRNVDKSLTDKYYDAELLIIDDLGVEISNQFSLSVIYNLINTRLNSKKSTIINSNLTQNELRDKYSDRITSRIFGEYIPLVFTGTDIRRQKLISEV